MFQINLGAIGVDMVLNREPWDRGMREVQAETLKAGNGLSGDLVKVGTKAGQAFAAALVSGFAAGAAGLAMATQQAANFEEAVVTAGAKSKATKEELEQMFQAATQVGLTTQLSAQQAGDGLNYLAMAGLNAQQQIAALPGVAQLAVAGNLELATAADIATNVMSGMGVGVDQLTRVNDVLAKTANSANTSVEELGRGMSFAAPVATAMGLSMEQTSAAIGKLSDSGIKSGRAGRGLNMILREMSGVAEQLGVKFSTADIKTKGFTNVIREFEKAGLTAGNVFEYVGSETAPALASLLNQGMDSLDALTEKLNNAGGAAQEMVDKMLDTFAGQQKLLKSAIESTSIALGRQLLPIFKPLVTMLGRSVGAIGLNDDALESFRKTAVWAVRGIAQVIEAGAGLVDISYPVVAAFKLIAHAMYTAFIRIPNFVLKSLGAMGAAIGTFILGNMTAVAAMGELVAKVLGIEGLENATENWRKKVQTMMTDTAKFGVDLAKSAANDVGDVFRGAFDAVSKEDTDKITSSMRVLSGSLYQGAQASDDLRAEQVRAAEAAEMWVGPLQNVSDAIDDQTDKLGKLKGATDEQREAMEKLAKAYDKAGDAMQRAMEKAKAAADKQATAVGDAMAAARLGVSRAQDKGKDAADKAATEAKEKADRELNERRAAIEEASKAKAGTIASAAGAFGMGPMPGLVDALTQMQSAGPALQLLGNAATGLVGVFANLWAQTEGVQAILAALGEVFDKGVGEFVEFIAGDLAKVLMPILDILSALAPVIQLLFVALNPVIAPLRLLATLMDKLAKPIHGMANAIRRFINGIDVFIRNLGRRKSRRASLDREGNIIDPKRDGTPIVIIYWDEQKEVEEKRKEATAAAEATLGAALATVGTMRTAREAGEQFKAILWQEREERRKGIEALRKFSEAMNVSTSILIRDQLERMSRFDQGLGYGFENGRIVREEASSELGRMLGGSFQRFAESMRNAREAVDDFSEEILNAPEVFDAALARYQAASGNRGITMPGAGANLQPAGGGNVYNFYNPQFHVSDIDGLEAQLEALARNRTGSPLFLPGAQFSITEFRR